MFQCSIINLKLSNFQFNNLKSAIENATKENIKPSSNMICNTNRETNFPQKLLSTVRQVSELCKTFANNFSTKIKLSKPQFLK